MADPNSWAAKDVGVDVDGRYGVWSVSEIVAELKPKADRAKFGTA